MLFLPNVQSMISLFYFCFMTSVFFFIYESLNLINFLKNVVGV